ESMSIGAVIVAYEVGSRFCPGKGLGDLSVTSRSAAALREKCLANRRRFGPSLPTTHGGTIAAVCSRCRSPRNLRIRHRHPSIDMKTPVRDALDALFRSNSEVGLHHRFIPHQFGGGDR